MEEKKLYTLDDIKKQAKVRRVTGSAEVVDNLGHMHNIDEEIAQADKEIEELQKKSTNLNLRLSTKELERCKKVAEYKGLKYQTYIKMILKQALDKDERDMNSAY